MVTPDLNPSSKTDDDIPGTGTTSTSSACLAGTRRMRPCCRRHRRCTASRWERSRRRTSRADSPAYRRSRLRRWSAARPSSLSSCPRRTIRRRRRQRTVSSSRQRRHRHATPPRPPLWRHCPSPFRFRQQPSYSGSLSVTLKWHIGVHDYLMRNPL